MRIAVDKITDKEILLTEDIPASTWDMDSFDIKFVNNLNLNCKFLRSSEQVFVNVHVCLHRIIVCSKCLEESFQVVEQDFSLNYNTKDLGKYLEIDDDIREEILLNFPMRVLCNPDCKGLCPYCGLNLNFKKCECKSGLEI